MTAPLFCFARSLITLLACAGRQTREARLGGSGEHRPPRRRLGGRSQAAVRPRKFRDVRFVYSYKLIMATFTHLFSPYLETLFAFLSQKEAEQTRRNSTLIIPIRWFRNVVSVAILLTRLS